VNDHVEDKESKATFPNHATQYHAIDACQQFSRSHKTAAQFIPPDQHNQNTTMLGAIAGLQPRQLAAQVLNFALVLSTAFMLWKGLSVATDSSSPIVVVLSGSMEPAFQRGDLLFLWNRGVETQVGEVVVYNVRGKDIPIVHRVIRKYGGG
jgi:hypothetical protein